MIGPDDRLEILIETDPKATNRDRSRQRHRHEPPGSHREYRNDREVRNAGAVCRTLKESKSSDIATSLIGQFGVGFYSAFMVADRVTLVTRRAGEDTGTQWESTGDGTYSISDARRFYARHFDHPASEKDSKRTSPSEDFTAAVRH